MNTVVCIKAVPSTTEVKMDPVTNTLVRDGRQSVVNPFDQTALEVAVRLKEQLGGRVCALSMGIPDTERLLRDCLARGADQGLLLSDRAFAGADTLATSYSLSCGLADLTKNGWHTDLVICGKMAVDGDTAQIGPELACVLGVPCVTDVLEVVAADEQQLTLRRATDAGEAIVRHHRRQGRVHATHAEHLRGALELRGTGGGAQCPGSGRRPRAHRPCRVAHASRALVHP